MQVLVELIAGLVALLASLVLSQLGVDIHAPATGKREVHRVQDCRTDDAGALKTDARPDC